jgi:hypothetical protein
MCPLQTIQMAAGAPYDFIIVGSRNPTGKARCTINGAILPQRAHDRPGGMFPVKHSRTMIRNESWAPAERRREPEGVRGAPGQPMP